MFISLSNDSWFMNTLGAKQHYLMTMARAIEYRLPLVRVGQSGISAAILPDGTFLTESPQSRSWAERVTIPLTSDPQLTFYARFPHLVLTRPAVCLSHHLATTKKNHEQNNFPLPAFFSISSTGWGKIEASVTGVTSEGKSGEFELKLKNTFDKSVKSARVWVFMFDDDGKVAGNQSQWLFGGDGNKKTSPSRRGRAQLHCPCSISETFQQRPSNFLQNHNGRRQYA